MHDATRTDEISELRAENARLASEREHYHRLYLATLEQCRKLELGLLGQKAERLAEPEAQLTMALLAELLGRPAQPEPAPPPQTVKEHTRKKPTGRKPLPDHLPRVDLEVLPPEVERAGTDAFDRIGEDVSEVVEKRPASLVVVRVTRGKFVRKDRERLAETEVLVADPLELPIERGLAGPGLLADSVVRRWQDHLPLHRLESIYAREGLALARSTMCGWHADLADLAKPLVAAMWQDGFTCPYLCTDATGVLVQAKDKCRGGHFWVVVAPERHVLYAYSPKHDSAAVDRLLAGYRGHLVADAHAVYDHLYKSGLVVEVGCWCHGRRYYWKALESDPGRARTALALIGELFRIERGIADSSLEERALVRQRDSRPVVDRFFAWCDAEAPLVLDDTPIAKAIGYAQNQRVALSRFLDDARLPLHNNASELALRRQVVGRRNWLFVGNDDAAEVNTTFVTLLASARLHEIEPWAYLRDVFCLLPSWPSRRILELAPACWKQTLEQEDTQQRLAANVFRRASLGKLEHRDT
ncbi:MAG: IS66 family transposase [Thermodesulfobacteriota bacterium]